LKFMLLVLKVKSLSLEGQSFALVSVLKVEVLL